MIASRRWTLRSIAASAAIAGLGLSSGYYFLARQESQYPVNRGKGEDRLWGPIRPPGAVEEEAFLAGCIRCTKCQDACEPGAIQFYAESEGKHFHTPYVDPAIKACNLCMKCTQVCPTGVLEPLTLEDKSKVRMARLELREDLCLSFKAKRIRDEQATMMDLGIAPTESDAAIERRGPCGECFMFCPLRGKAIELEPGAFLAPIVHDENCAGCGMCEEICRVIVRGEPAIRVLPIRDWV